MNDEKIQAWLDGDGKEKPDSSDMNLYQRLYATLSMEPDDNLPENFAQQMAARVGLRESGYSPDWFVAVLVAIAMSVSFVAVIAISINYLPVNLSIDLTSLTSILPLPSETWIYTLLVALLLGAVDRLLLLPRIRPDTNA